MSFAVSPPSGVIRGVAVYCDSAFSRVGSIAAIGCVLFDQMVKLSDGSGQKVLASLVLVAEALAVKEACHIFRVRNFEQATVFSDGKSVISSLLSVDLDPTWEVAAIIQ